MEAPLKQIISQLSDIQQGMHRLDEHITNVEHMVQEAFKDDDKNVDVLAIYILEVKTDINTVIKTM